MFSKIIASVIVIGFVACLAAFGFYSAYIVDDFGTTITGIGVGLAFGYAAIDIFKKEWL